MTIKLYIATSLDGYIADRDDKLDWLFEVQGEGDNGYEKFLAQIDHVIMGRKTYDWLINQIQNVSPEAWPYAKKKVYVLSRQNLPDNDQVKFIHSENFSQFISQLSGNTWLVGGGELIRLCLELQLLEELQITIAPVLLGEGTPLFPKGDYSEKMLLLDTTRYGQFVELHYKIK